MKRFVTVLLAIFIANSLTGCALMVKKSTQVAKFDFGPSTVSTEPRLAAPVSLFDIEAPPWLATSAIHYRLLPEAPQQLRTYGQSVWLASPPTLLELYLSPALDAAYLGDSTADHFRLYLQLESLEQIFTSDTRASVTLRLRAQLRNKNGRILIAQRAFSYSEESPSPDALGAVVATAGLVDRLRKDLLTWLEEIIRDATA